MFFRQTFFGTTPPIGKTVDTTYTNITLILLHHTHYVLISSQRFQYDFLIPLQIQKSGIPRNNNNFHFP